MSNIESVNIESNTPKKEPFCRVCFNKGKSKKVYRSHYIWSEKNMSGVIVCPELKDILNMECHYCHEIGHSTGYCYKLKMRDFGCRHCDTFKHKRKNCKLYREWRDERNSRRVIEIIERQEQRQCEDDREERRDMQEARENAWYRGAMWNARNSRSQQYTIQDDYDSMLLRRD
jgi:hypothetical protein